MQPTSNRSARRLRGAPARRAAANIWMQPREEENTSEGAFVPEKCSHAVTELLCLILNNSGSGSSSTEWSRGPTWTKLTSQNGLITLSAKWSKQIDLCFISVQAGWISQRRYIHRASRFRDLQTSAT